MAAEHEGCSGRDIILLLLRVCQAYSGSTACDDIPIGTRLAVFLLLRIFVNWGLDFAIVEVTAG